MKFKVKISQEHIIFIEAEDENEAVRKVRSMNDAEVLNAETFIGDMIVSSVERI